MSDYAEIQLTNEDVDTAIHCFFRNLEDTRIRYNKGLVTDSELIDKVALEISNAFRDCFITRGFSFIMDKKQNWIRYKEEYDLYKQGEIAFGKSGSVWLTYDGKEAAPEDKNQLFRMNDLLCLPVDFYMPIDAELTDDVPRPGLKQEVHTYGNGIAYNLYINCVDDDGLMRDANPIGKLFNLKCDYDLSTFIVVKGYQKNLSGEVCGIKGNGWIEGYTKCPNENILDIVIYWDKEKHINRIGYFESKEDYIAYASFPLWQTFFKKADERLKRRTEWYQNCIEKLRLKSLPSFR